MDIDPDPTVTRNLDGNTDDFFLLKLDSDGHYVWGSRIGGGYADFCLAITVDDQASVYATGYIGGPVDFDPGPGTHIIMAGINVATVFVLKLDTSGNFVLAATMGGNNSRDVGYNIFVDRWHNIYTTGTSMARPISIPIRVSSTT